MADDSSSENESQPRYVTLYTSLDHSILLVTDCYQRVVLNAIKQLRLNAWVRTDSPLVVFFKNNGQVKVANIFVYLHTQHLKCKIVKIDTSPEPIPIWE